MGWGIVQAISGLNYALLSLLINISSKVLEAVQANAGYFTFSDKGPAI